MSSGQNADAHPICHILREDPDLAEVLAPHQRDWAIEECIAPTTRIPRGQWSGKVPD